MRHRKAKFLRPLVYTAIDVKLKQNRVRYLNSTMPICYTLKFRYHRSIRRPSRAMLTKFGLEKVIRNTTSIYLYFKIYLIVFNVYWLISKCFDFNNAKDTVLIRFSSSVGLVSKWCRKSIRAVRLHIVQFHELILRVRLFVPRWQFTAQKE